MMEKLFAYGTLAQPRVQNLLCNRIIPSIPDVLLRYRKSMVVIDNLKYPIAIPSPNDSIDGKVLEVTPNELRIFDMYEGEDYRRVQEKLKSGTLAWVYVR
jgi:gamma-glutamylcyclotransferase (GGCT)/AIG2-like uncharacterized protein YtfP